MSTAKQRHYTALSSRLRALKINLAESEVQMDLLSQRLRSMQKLAANHGAQFMAVSRLIDKDIEAENKVIEEAESVAAAAASRIAERDSERTANGA